MHVIITVDDVWPEAVEILVVYVVFRRLSHIAYKSRPIHSHDSVISVVWLKVVVEMSGKLSD